MEYKCVRCNTEIESDDNFCPKCGHWTAKGYSFLKSKDNLNMITNGDVAKQDKAFSTLISLLGIGFILFAVMMFLQGDDLFKPIIYLKKQVTNYIYGYNISTIKATNKYINGSINTYEDAIDFIKKDFSEQKWLCENNLNVSLIEYELEKKLNIPSVVFCDASYEISLKLKETINKMYNLFPNIQGILTNITITNSDDISEYIAYFQPQYQFVNVNKNIENFNKVNKTQILLNSYYFLNDNILNADITSITGNDFYVSDATWESIVAHELGHYISFVILLRENGLNNITLETIDNQAKINNIISIFNSGIHSTKIVEEALENYNNKYNLNDDIFTFAKSISKYASSKDENGNLIADETIAEAIHDYYLHGNNMKASSKEIVNIIKNKLGDL